MQRALVVVDVQNDFVEGGALAVPGGINVANRIANYITNWGEQYAEIVFTSDWHNALPDSNGGHFAVYNEPDYVNSWPEHCVGHTPGAQIHYVLTPLIPTLVEHVFFKGQGKPDYSGFQGVNGAGKDLDAYFLDHDIESVDVVGIAGDYCVRATALDAKDFGYEVRILPEYVASVGGDSATLAAVKEVEDRRYRG